MRGFFMVHLRYIQRLVVLMVMALVLSACATTADRMDNLQQTLRSFEKAIRWAQFDTANSFRQWGVGEQPMLPEHYKNIRVTSYQPMNVQFTPDKMGATQSVTIRYYRTDTSREESLRHDQKWEYSEKNKRWYLVSELPKFQ